MALTAPGVLEIAYGLANAGARTASPDAGLAWFTWLVCGDLVTTLALDDTAAVVAGRLRAIAPTPPTGRRRTGSNPEQRVGWLQDLQIAACAWAHGHALATHNRRDFDAIRELIDTLYPAAPALEVVDPPTW